MSYSNDTIKYALIVIYIISFILAITGNLIVILVRVYHRRTNSAYKLLICHLALSDIIYPTAIPFQLAVMFGHDVWPLEVVSCKLIKTTHSAAFTASIGIMTVLAAERFQGTRDPLRHRWSSRKVHITIIIVWIVSYINFIPYTIALDVQYGYCHEYNFPSEQFRKGYTAFQFGLTYILPLICVAYFHYRIATVVKVHRKDIRHRAYTREISARGSVSSNSSTGLRQARLNSSKMTKVLTLIVTLFATLTLPFQIWFIWHEFTDRSSQQNANLDVVAVFGALVFVHSGINPIVYSIMDKQFRTDIRFVFRRRSSRTPSQISSKMQCQDTTISRVSTI